MDFRYRNHEGSWQKIAVIGEKILENRKFLIITDGFQELYERKQGAGVRLVKERPSKYNTEDEDEVDKRIEEFCAKRKVEDIEEATTKKEVKTPKRQKAEDQGDVTQKEEIKTPKRKLSISSASSFTDLDDLSSPGDMSSFSLEEQDSSSEPEKKRKRSSHDSKTRDTQVDNKSKRKKYGMLLFNYKMGTDPNAKNMIYAYMQIPKKLEEGNLNHHLFQTCGYQKNLLMDKRSRYHCACLEDRLRRHFSDNETTIGEKLRSFLKFDEGFGSLVGPKTKEQVLEDLKIRKNILFAKALPFGQMIPEVSREEKETFCTKKMLPRAIQRRSLPAMQNPICYKCGRRGHFASQCRQNTYQRN